MGKVRAGAGRGRPALRKVNGRGRRYILGRPLALG